MSAEEQVTLEPPVAATSTEEFAKAPDSKADRTEYLRRVPFGSRYLTETDDVFSHNAWDHVVPPPEWEEEARQKLDFHRQHKVEEEKKEAYNSRPSYYWDKFYLAHKENFFKDRNWLRLEFPELLATSTVDAGPKKVVEIGCGAGNTVFPLLSVNENPDLVVHACDFSKRAVEVVKVSFEPTRYHCLLELNLFIASFRKTRCILFHLTGRVFFMHQCGTCQRRP